MPFRVLRFLKATGRDALVLMHALRDPRTPAAIKAAIVALAFYVLSPVDLLPDVALLFGWADDVALLVLAVPWLAKRLPADVRARAEAAAASFGRPRA